MGVFHGAALGSYHVVVLGDADSDDDDSGIHV